jgi:hypothetical protein
MPLVSSYMLFSSNGDDFWIINGLLSAFSLYFFANYLIFATSLYIGAFAGYLLYIFSEVPHSQSSIMSMGYVLLSSQHKPKISKETLSCVGLNLVRKFACMLACTSVGSCVGAGSTILSFDRD